MTFIQREDCISDLRYNIHAAKLHFFCAAGRREKNKKAQIERPEALVCELQASPKLPELLSGTIAVIQSKNGYYRGRHDLWTHAYLHFWSLLRCSLEGPFCGALPAVHFLIDFLV